MKRVRRVDVVLGAFLGRVQEYPVKNVKKSRFHRTEALKILPGRLTTMVNSCEDLRGQTEEFNATHLLCRTLAAA